jgi:cytochrome c oxidase subunit III
MTDRVIARRGRIPVGPLGREGVGWWGVGTLIATEAALFTWLLFSYFYLVATNPTGWVLEPHPALHLALPNTMLLLASSVAAWWGERSVREERHSAALIGLGLAFVMGAIFAGVQWHEWQEKPFGVHSSAYGALYFVTTGFHMAHVLVGLAVLAALWGWTLAGLFGRRRNLHVAAGVLYWHFVDAVWLFVFATWYLTPWAGLGT